MQLHSWQQIEDAASRLERLCVRPEHCNRLATGEVQSVAKQLRRVANSLKRAHEQAMTSELAAETKSIGPFSFGRGAPVGFPSLSESIA